MISSTCFFLLEDVLDVLPSVLPEDILPEEVLLEAVFLDEVCPERVFLLVLSFFLDVDVLVVRTVLFSVVGIGYQSSLDMTRVITN